MPYSEYTKIIKIVENSQFVLNKNCVFSKNPLVVHLPKSSKKCRFFSNFDFRERILVWKYDEMTRIYLFSE